MADITSVPPFDPYEQAANVGPRWTRWKTRLQYYIDAKGFTADHRKRALLLHTAGPAVQDIFSTLSDTGTSYAEALNSLEAYFIPQKNLHFERHSFRQAHQAASEPVDQFIHVSGLEINFFSKAPAGDESKKFGRQILTFSRHFFQGCFFLHSIFLMTMYTRNLCHSPKFTYK